MELEYSHCLDSNGNLRLNVNSLAVLQLERGKDTGSSVFNQSNTLTTAVNESYNNGSLDEDLKNKLLLLIRLSSVQVNHQRRQRQRQGRDNSANHKLLTTDAASLKSYYLDGTGALKEGLRFLDILQLSEKDIQNRAVIADRYFDLMGQIHQAVETKALTTEEGQLIAGLVSQACGIAYENRLTMDWNEVVRKTKRQHIVKNKQTETKPADSVVGRTKTSERKAPYTEAQNTLVKE